jgi:hypothetical protein
MKTFTVLTMLVGTVLVAGCANHEGISLSESKFIDNNCSGNGWITNEEWCTDGLHPAAGPWASSSAM